MRCWNASKKSTPNAGVDFFDAFQHKGETTKSFGKNLGKTEDILTLLSKNKATIRVDVKQAKAPCRMRKSSLRKPAAKRTS